MTATDRYAIHLVPADARNTLVGVIAVDEPTLDLDTVREFATDGGSGYVELVSVDLGGERVDVWCDEEGLLKGSTRNAHASLLADRILVGPALIATHTADGDSVGLTREATQRVFDRMGIEVNIDDHITNHPTEDHA